MFSFLTGQTDSHEQEHSGAQIVETVVDRLASSHIIDDRRDAVRTLKGLSKRFRFEIGDKAITSLIVTLKNDISDHEIASSCLDCLYNIISTEPPSLSDAGLSESPPLSPDNLDRFSDLMILQCPQVSPAESALQIALECLDEFEFSVLLNSIKFVTQLLRLKITQVQQVILEKPMAISRLIDTMRDQREIIRNEAILALSELTREAPAIQKIVVFENTFETVLDIMDLVFCEINF